VRIFLIFGLFLSPIFFTFSEVFIELKILIVVNLFFNILNHFFIIFSRFLIIFDHFLDLILCSFLFICLIIRGNNYIFWKMLFRYGNMGIQVEHRVGNRYTQQVSRLVSLMNLSHGLWTSSFLNNFPVIYVFSLSFSLLWCSLVCFIISVSYSDFQYLCIYCLMNFAIVFWFLVFLRRCLHVLDGCYFLVLQRVLLKLDISTSWEVGFRAGNLLVMLCSFSIFFASSSRLAGLRVEICRG
jgi:hypothetical protein